MPFFAMERSSWPACASDLQIGKAARDYEGDGALEDTSKVLSQCPLWVKSDVCNAQGHFRFAPHSRRESGLAQTVTTRDVRFGPIAASASEIKDRDRLSQVSNQRSHVAYFASIAVTSTSIIMYGQASWGTFSNVDAGIGASPNASLRHFNAS